jgi:creatinine amidohydrolase
VLLPTVPFGNNNTQLNQVATITMRTRTQLAVLTDVAESLVRQGIHRLVILNFHGANEFKPLIRDVMLDWPIFIVQMHGFQLAPKSREVISPEGRGGDHADEWETSVMMHLVPDLVAPLSTAGDGATTPSALPTLTGTPGVWSSRHWPSLTRDTGAGDPRHSTTGKGAHLFSATVEAAANVLVELSSAREGQFPLVIDRSRPDRT